MQRVRLGDTVYYFDGAYDHAALVTRVYQGETPDGPFVGLTVFWSGRPCEDKPGVLHDPHGEKPDHWRARDEGPGVRNRVDPTNAGMLDGDAVHLPNIDRD